MTRPRIIIPARFSETASALRFRALVVARSLAAAVFRAGAEPLVVQPWAPCGAVTDADVADRLRGLADGILLPGGGDLAPATYGATRTSERVYDVDEEQDAFDLAVARAALATGIPLLAVCRGMQVVNVALGGTLVQDMAGPDGHRSRLHTVECSNDTLLTRSLRRSSANVSCHHHQCVDRLAPGLIATARADDGTVEAVELESRSSWVLGVQWHPEDTADTDASQQALFGALVMAAGSTG